MSIRMILAVLALIACQVPGFTSGAAAADGLRAFSSDKELARYLRRVREVQPPEPVPMPPPPSAPAPVVQSVAPVSGASMPASITNNQIAGVDEGDIVKAKGDILVVLRRGRLFTVSLADGGVRSSGMIDAYPPGVDPQGDWYDEMLISGNRVIVIGYSYRRGGTQLVRFKLAGDGKLSFEDAYHLRSDDYYSSRNYASRLIGTKIYLYSPLRLDSEDLAGSLPAMRKWAPGVEGTAGFRLTSSAQQIYVPEPYRDVRQARVDRLHTVTECDIAAAALECRSTGVLGGWSRNFFVSSNAVYVWIGDAFRRASEGRATSLLYRLPLDNGPPSAVATRGTPIDQFSFAPDTKRSALHVLVRSLAGGDAMWSSEVSAGSLALVSIPMTAFGNGAKEVAVGRYTRLPQPSGQVWNLQNRFVGDHLVYAGGSTGVAGEATVVSVADRVPVRLRLPHGVDRLDAIGSDAIAIGAGGNALGFTTISLDAQGISKGETFLLPDAREAEARSHAFYFRPDAGSSDGSGLLGLPVARASSAGVLFLSRRQGRLAEAGRLDASPSTPNNDSCRASCTDWYGNARPIFFRDRVFALLGYEIVEGARENDTVAVATRASFAPNPR